MHCLSDIQYGTILLIENSTQTSIPATKQTLGVGGGYFKAVPPFKPRQTRPFQTRMGAPPFATCSAPYGTPRFAPPRTATHR